MDNRLKKGFSLLLVLVLVLSLFPAMALPALAATPGTVDDAVTPAGTIMNLFDYWINNQTENEGENGNGQPEGPNTGINSGHALKFTQTNNYTTGTVNHWTGTDAGVLQGIVSDSLGNDGYPVLSGEAAIFKSGVSNGDDKQGSLAYLFDPDTAANGKAAYENVGGLLQIDETGYYVYNSQENYAYFNEESSSFKLYEDWAVRYPDNDNGTTGMFFPFNDYPDSKTLSADNKNLNHYFGMTLTTRFIQQHGGYTDYKQDTRTTFEFSGDDDVWIFVDGVLVADLGGIHDAASVKIDFAAGTVTISNVYGKAGEQVTCFEDIFKNTGVELQEVDSSIDTTGRTTPRTLKDDNYYTLKFFYLERGGNASNLQLKYNLSTTPSTGVTFIDQYGQVITDADFDVYDKNGNKSDINVTIDSEGKMVFSTEDGLPLSMDEIEDKLGSTFTLKNITAPAGYRLVSNEIKLSIVNGILMCEDQYTSGVWASPILQVTATNQLQLVDTSINIDGVVNDGVVDYYDADSSNGTLFAVVLKYIGAMTEDDDGNLVVDTADYGGDIEKAMADQGNWALVYGTAEGGFTVAKVSGETPADFITEAIKVAQLYTESDNVFTIAASGQMQGSLNGMPGELDTYYYMLDEDSKNQTQYTVAYYWSSVDLKDDRTANWEQINSSNTYRVNSDATVAAAYAFERAFGATIEVPVIVNKVYVQNLTCEGGLLEGGKFAMYVANPTTGGYTASDNTTSVILSGTNTATVGDSTGTYEVNPSTGVINVTMTDGATYTINPAKNASGNELITTATTSEEAPGVFSYVPTGPYFVRQISGSTVDDVTQNINLTSVMVWVGNNAIYANAGTQDDGVTVARGPGHVMSSMNQFASQGDIDNTLTWIYTMLRGNTEVEGFGTENEEITEGWYYAKADGTTTKEQSDAMRTYLIYNPDTDSTIFNYIPHVDRNADGEPILTDGKMTSDAARNADGSIRTDQGMMTRRLYTDVGWSYIEVFQNYYYGKQATDGTSVNYTNLHGEGSENSAISELFTRSVYIQVTAPEYTLTYDPNGGTDGPDTDTGLLLGEHELNSKDVPTREPVTPVGETEAVEVAFIGWTENQDEKIYAKGDTDYDPSKVVTTVTISTDKLDEDGNMTVYALWGYDTNNNGTADVLETPHNIIYYANNGGEDNEPFAKKENVLPGEYDVGTEQVPEYEGKVFLYWTTDTSAQGQTYKDASQLPEKAEKVTVSDADVILYAIWGDDDKGGTDGGDNIADVYQIFLKFKAEGNGAVSPAADQAINLGTATYGAVDFGADGNAASVTATAIDGNIFTQWSWNDGTNDHTSASATLSGIPDGLDNVLGGTTITFTASFRAENINLSVEKTLTSIGDTTITEDMTDIPMAKVGDTITWTITVTNTGNVELTNITVKDQLSNATGAVTIVAGTEYTVNDDGTVTISSLDMNADVKITVTYEVLPGDAGNTISNKATVKVDGDDGPSGEDDSEVTVAMPGLSITKEVDKTSANVGDILTYTITVTNTGEVTLENISVTDTMLGVKETIDSLVAGSEWKNTYTYTVKYSDAGKTIVNTAVAKVDGKEEEASSEGTKINTPYVPPVLNTEDHMAYIIGYEDGSVRPENNITRAEVATIFFRLLTDESRAEVWSQDNTYSDVAKTAWYNSAVSTMSNAGIVSGYPDGTFCPDKPITRAEFATIAARFSEVVYNGGNSFTDVTENHWASRYIALAEYLGWINGYPDGTFKPDQAITRAEAMTLINRVLERAVEEEHMLPDMVTWVDNLPSAWYYEAVQEATNSHEYTRLTKQVPDQDFNYEDWREILEIPDWASLEKVWSTANSK